MISDGSGTNTPGPAADYYATWLGTAGPRIAATCVTAPLPVLVEAVLDALASAGKSFTAYDVTRILRALVPRRQLPHYEQQGAPGVQPEVHRQMADYLAGGDYTVRTVYPNGADPAQLYMPVKRRRRGRGALTLVPLPTPAPGASLLPLRAWVVQDQ